MVTPVDRKSGLLRTHRVRNGEVVTVMRAIVSALHPLQARVHTLTWDNCSGFAEHVLLDIAQMTKSYFANHTRPSSAAPMKIPTGRYGNISPKGATSALTLTPTFRRLKTSSTNGLEND